MRAEERGAAAPFLALDGITKAFGRFTALAGVSLEVPRGTLVTFLGPSGCGKTTLLRIIAGLETQDGGRILREGRDISRLPAIKRDYGIVFQSYALFPNLTIFDNVAYGLVNRRAGRAQMRARGRSIPASSRAGSSSASRSPARSPRRRDCCCSTSRCPRSMRRSACACAPRSARCSSDCPSPRSW